MAKWLRNALLVALSMLLVVANLSEVNAPPAKAIDAAQFDPGLIISDSVFNDFGAMTVDDIQAFLDRQVPTCRGKTSGIKPGDITCLKLYKENISGSYAIRSSLHSYNYAICSEVPAASNQSAAQIIYSVSRACKINPRVILVTLQKEQGLIQASKPTTYMYKAAMGYGCPDSAPQVCGTDSNSSSRLFWQLYRAAWQLKWYGDPRGSFNYYRVGRTIKMAYHPAVKVNGVFKNTCGSQSFVLKSAATAKLYYYTPYVPNAAALKNLWGTGDKCSAYGNRNFWRWYWKWFGSPIGGGFLLQSDNNSAYLVVDNKKYRLTSTELQAVYSPLGPLGKVSKDYLDSFATQTQELGRLIKNSSGVYYLVDNGRLYPFTGCAQVTDFGLACASAVQLTNDQIAAFTMAQTVSNIVPSDAALAKPALYQISGGIKREILDAAAAAAASVNITSVLPVSIDAFASLPWGAPIARENQLITNRSNNQKLIIHAGKAYQVDAATSSDIDLSKWFAPSAGSLSSDGISSIRDTNAIRSIVRDATNFYLLSNGGKQLITDPADLVGSANQLPNTLLAMIPTVEAALLTPTLAKSAASNDVYWLDAGKKRLVPSADVKTKVASISANQNVMTISKSALDLVAAGSPVQAPGQLLIDSKKDLYVVNGLNSLVKVRDQALANAFGLGKPKKVTASEVAGYTKSTTLNSFKAQCGTQQYLAIKGKLQPIAADYASHYPGGVQALDDLTCKYLSFGTTQLGRFVKSPGGFTYLVENGKRRLIAKASQYRAVRASSPGQFEIDMTFALALPIGKNYPTSIRTPIPLAASASTPSPSATATPTPTSTPKATASATPTPTLTKSATPSATASQSASPCGTLATYKSGVNWFHIVTSGETLGKIAKACGTTAANLDTWNSVVKDVNSIQVGWIIRVTNN